MTSIQPSMASLMISFFLVNCSIAVEREKDKNFIAVLNAAQKDDFALALDSLHDLNDNSATANVLLIKLLDYYIGEGAGEIQAQLITEKGKVMLTLLRAKKKKATGMSPGIQIPLHG